MKTARSFLSFPAFSPHLHVDTEDVFHSGRVLLPRAAAPKHTGLLSCIL